LTDNSDGWLNRLLDVLAALILLALMLLTCVDVAGRYLFNAPLQGATELTQLTLAGIIFAALPAVSRREDHICVDLLDSVFPRAWINSRQLLINLLCAGALAAIAWQVWIIARRTAQYGDRTEFLELPLAPVVYFIGAMCALAALMLALNALRYLRGQGSLSPR
jgi:TRAP-type C4-dicarboxylate transport system permease small subunit